MFNELLGHVTSITHGLNVAPQLPMMIQQPLLSVWAGMAGEIIPREV
jgi:hypothetical protein